MKDKILLYTFSNRWKSGLRELNFKLHQKMSKSELNSFLLQISSEPVTDSTHFLFS